VANGQHRKKSIHSLVQDKGTIEGLDNLKSYITNYYKNKFGSPEEGNFHMDETQTEDIPQVSIKENNQLTAKYSEEEVRKAMFQMEHNKALVLMAFQVSFIKPSGILSKGTFLILLVVFMLDN
jgi:hypothetical protein